jgi:hypothetical protein
LPDELEVFKLFCLGLLKLDDSGEEWPDGILFLAAEILLFKEEDDGRFDGFKFMLQI